MEAYIMNNEVLEKVLQFLKQLKGENNSRKLTVQITGLKKMERETEQLWQNCYPYIEKLPMQEIQEIQKWIEKNEEYCSLQEQNAYCQGYVDCVLLLAGLGLFKPEVSIDKFIEQVNK